MVYYLHSQCMNKQKRATIRTLFIVKYSDILNKARKAQNGLRTQHLFSIQLLGEYPEGLGVSEAGRLAGKSPQDIYNRFVRVMKVGFIYRADKRYYLTDSGKCVYNSICKEFDQSMNEILSVLMDEVRRKM